MEQTWSWALSSIYFCGGIYWDNYILNVWAAVEVEQRKENHWKRTKLSCVQQHSIIIRLNLLYVLAPLKLAGILAPKLTSRACALRVCSPPAAIAVTQAISQTLICKALRIDSPSHAQMNKQRHKTWSFCLKYYILSKPNKIERQVGGIFHLWQFLLDQIAHGPWPGIKKWRHVNKWKPWSFQLHCTVKPYFSVTKWKMHLLNTW